jgi:beta-lactamase class C
MASYGLGRFRHAVRDVQLHFACVIYLKTGLAMRWWGIRTLNAWKADKAPGQRHLYTHAGFVLLQLALERRYPMPIDELIDQPVLQPLVMTSTMLPRGDDGPRGRLTPEYKSRAVQGYSDNSEPIGQPGEQTSYYHWPGTGQMYSSPRDMMAFLAANLDELPLDQSLHDATALAHRSVFRIGPRNSQALAWEILDREPTIIEKYGGLNNASAYIGMMPSRKLGIVILGNRGNQYPNERADESSSNLPPPSCNQRPRRSEQAA